MEKRRIIICEDCEEKKPHRGLGMCNRCYSRKRYTRKIKDILWVERRRKRRRELANEPKRKEYYNAIAKGRFLDKYKKPCEVCGEKKVHKHHIDNNPRNNVITNIKWLCPLHHSAVHRKMKNKI